MSSAADQQVTAPLPPAGVAELTYIPRQPRGISDLSVLDSLSPMQHTLKHWGRLESEMALYIGKMITDTLAEARRAHISDNVTVRPLKRAA